MHDENDAASNPLKDEHLPVGGETTGDDDSLAPDIADDYDAGESDDDTDEPVLPGEDDDEELLPGGPVDEDGDPLSPQP